MFRSNDNDLLVNSKKISVKPQVSQNFTLTGSNNQIRFRLNPDTIPFFIPDRTYLKMEVEVKGDFPNYKPCASAGCHSLIRNLRCSVDGNEVESVQEYNSLVAMKYARNKTDSLSAKRTLFEGQSVCTTQEQQLYVDGIGDYLSGTETILNPSYKKIEVELPIHSGFFTREQLHPNVVCPLDLVFDLETKKRALQRIVAPKSTDADPISLLSTALTTNTAITEIVLDTPANAKKLGFLIGDKITIKDGSDEEELGTITSYGTATGNKLVLKFASHTTTNAYSVGSKVFVSTTEAEREANLDVELSNISLVMTSVQPPKEYVESLLQTASGKNGQTFQIQTFELQRTNLTSVKGLQSVSIPTQTYDKALSIFSIPFNTDTLQDQNYDTLVGDLDRCEQYQYIHGNEGIPSRPVNLGYFDGSQTPNVWSAIYHNELLKAYDNANIKCLDLHRVPETGWVFGRAWSDRNSVSDLSKEPLFLNVDYGSSSTMNKIMYHFMSNVRVVSVSNNGVRVF